MPVPLLKWCRQNPLQAFLLLTVFATCAYFLGIAKFFVHAHLSALGWGWEAWNPEGNQEHGKLVPLICLYLFWHHREAIAKAPKSGCSYGLAFVLAGVLWFVLSVRCLQPRMALSSIPLLLYGSVLFLWGKQVARILLFPCLFLLFMVPVAAVEQATFRLQFAVTGTVDFLAHLFGIDVQAVGTTLTARDGSFNFEIAEGCSGIRSITALTMLTAVYVHLTQNTLWKKVVIFCSSALFAIIGNAGRIFTIILMAKFYDTEVAAGIYHDYSGFIFFPVALGAMVGLAKLLSMPKLVPRKLGAVLKKENDNTSYDY